MKAILTLSKVNQLENPSSGMQELRHYAQAQSIRYCTTWPGSQVEESRLGKNSISLSMSEHDNFITFNLPCPAHALVTVYDLEGNILSIQQFQSFRNTESLGLKNPLSQYVIRVQITCDDAQLN